MERRKVFGGKQKKLLFLFFILIIAMLFSNIWIQRFEKMHSNWIIARLGRYKSQVINEVTFYYKKSDEHHIEKISKDINKTLQQVNENLNVEETPSFDVVIYPNSMEMKKGLRLSSDGNTLGAYYGGNIFMLSPTQLNETNSPLENIFLHEYTHRLVEEKTNGNHPIWFTEGVALYQEYVVTGYEWGENYRYTKWPYTLAQLEEDFYQLDTFHAYRSSFLRIAFLAEQYGEESIIEIMEEMGSGRKYLETMKKTLKRSYHELENEFILWYQGRFYDKL